MSSSRWLAVFAAARVLVLGLAACGGERSAAACSTESRSSEYESGGAHARRSLRRNRRCRVERPAGGPGSLDRRIRERQLAAPPSPMTGSAPAAVANNSSPAASPSPAATRRCPKTKASSARRSSAADRANWSRSLTTSRRSRSSTTCPGVEELKLNPDTLAKIFNQEIENWNDPAIAKDNPGVELPDTRIVPVNRSDESGTTENFTDYLVQGGAQRVDARSERRMAGEGRRSRLRHLRRDRSRLRRRRRDRLRRRSAGAANSAKRRSKSAATSPNRRPKPPPKSSTYRKKTRNWSKAARTSSRSKSTARPRSRRRLPDHPGLLADRLHQIQVRRRSGPGEGVLRIRDQPRRAGSWPLKPPAPRRSRRR